MRILDKIKLHEISLVDNPAQAPARVAIMKRNTPGPPPEPDGITKGTSADDGKEELMSDKTPTADDKQAELQKAHDRLAEVVALPADQRQHFDSLQGADQDAFLAKSTEDRTAVIENLAKADPVVYTCDDGTELCKSAGEQTISLAKKLDETNRALSLQKAAAKRAGFEKRAEEELGHLPGEVVAKADLLAVVADLPAEKQTPIMEMLKANDAGIAQAMERKGTSEGTTEKSATEQLDTLAKKHAEEHKVDFAKAYDAVLSTKEGAALYNDHKEGK